ncbi:MAG: hypothetical protein RJS97_02165 [Parvibaculaceae bacterium]
MKTLNILVAGATGTNGKALLAEFTGRGLSARAFVRDRAKASDIAAMGQELDGPVVRDRSTMLDELAPHCVIAHERERIRIGPVRERL